MEWISVKDRLPEYKIPVLVLFNDNIHSRKNVFAVGYITTDIKNRKAKAWEFKSIRGWNAEQISSWMQYEVTHWMPLPTPPDRERTER
ncbi:DUF551 domain-containing protein [Pseudoflavonifractor sp. 524-17]|uniref:DUF551 domain-containing protein n=1 Tax=Pseudoflavonifractor sp. 524-17 TaxID=2304577 RepID=UPI00137B438F|nr:DUF551 domain-containing protein [Pseudoflavonifractor sp. 524-17]NCE63716.1 DUF551 domain-containing protein [Pseudoflavonifractor sp. 524-17]